MHNKHFPSRRQVLQLAGATGLLTGLPALAALKEQPGTTKVLKVGVTTGPHEQVFEQVRKVAERDYGLKIQLVPFTDYSRPNAALDAGDLDANSFQHRPFLAAQVRARGYKIVGFGRTWIGPIAIYSKKFKGFADLPEGARIAIPNDPANESRVLLLLQKAGAITLKTGIDPVAGVNATPRDIVENPKKFRFVEIEAAQLPRTLDDTDASAINADYANKAGLNPAKDSILLEDKDGPYACLVAVREQDKDQPWVQQLVKAYQTDEVREYIVKTFAGGVIPAF
ncbi:MetQ/NlpA family ABC transporter substrate-binding protein [Pseudorhodoferax sp. Leaf265]|uniref:MetQ/NlpA family ABC transporter substrate-binding protein n=1 Tax=Pseudorhodoferax sp. Leaf265 TaxID=1736315 RepID=UPI0006F8219C|nr:MetQ/NlpA family ABC transporter substrate-binding protein [Pseudorhodoferax sp. Leaf265]KQP19493.1 metal ABC transporter substrate-binding protein [Pseudorhodoferax sp. Leaf265]PZP95268.1 MAG: MetQ/NlpA family ABC transporter substrate-binding protein [Variovorax paradoxus]PZQ06001.1 MAG: MetQ/NlpA family ABC transporter substrate-binding protein [Variovorax paradoxus]